MRKELFKRVDIVIPIYNAYDSLVACIESIKEHTDLILHRVILVNDCSPDKRIKSYLDRLEGPGFVVLHNTENKGFSGSVNRGMSYSESNDVILLNTDTIVTKRWVEKLVECAYASKEIGTVTPLSNSATIASVPNAFMDNPLPKGKTVDEMAELVEHSSFREYPNITVAVGFCMFIKREVIQKVGLFDAETFRRGYGEENDFCNRAEIYGYGHVLCDDTFIFHEGTQSFLTAEREQLVKEHRLYLEENYPKQTRRNDIFCARNPQQYLRDNIVLHLALENGKKNVLYLVHFDFKEGAQNNCGGTQFHVKDLTEKRKDYNVFVAARDGNSLLLTAYVNEESYTFRFVIEEDPAFFTFRNRRLAEVFSMILDACRIDLVHVHHVVGLSFDIFDAAKERNIPLLLTLHDYFFICPNYTLINEKGVSCLGKCASCSGMKACLSHSLKVSNAEKYLTEWQKECDRVMDLCDCIFTPSESVRDIYCKIHPHMAKKIIALDHGLDRISDDREVAYSEPRYTKEIVYCVDALFAEGGYEGMICGWAYLQDCDNANTKIYLDVLQNDGSKRRYRTEKKKRPDVDAAFGGGGRYVNVGFSVGIHPSDCPSDRFTAELVIERNGIFYNNGESFGKEAPKPLPNRKLNVAFLGGMNIAKGSKKSYELILEDKDELINWYILGGIDPSEPLHDIVKSNVKKVGYYSRGEVDSLLQDYRIDIVCSLSMIETFSYVLSEAYINQVPVVAVDLWALGERVDKLGCGWLVKPDSTAKEIYETILRITSSPQEYQKVKEKIAGGRHKTVAEMAEEYATYYSKLYRDDIRYQVYDAKKFYQALETKSDVGISEDKYRLLSEELQQKLQQIENSFWYKLTKNLHCIEFPGKIRLRNWVYRVVGTWKAKKNK